MSFILIAAAVAAVAGATGVAFGKRRPPTDPNGNGSPRTGAKDADMSVNQRGADEVDPLAAVGRKEALGIKDLVLDLGDVVSALDEERWLSGALVATDGSAPIGALFFAPEGSRFEVVAAFPAPRRDIAWLSPTEIEIGAEPPTSLEFGSLLVHRKSRIPVTLKRLGQGAPDAPTEGIWAEYASTGGGRAIVLRAGIQTFAYVGRSLDEGQYDRMGKG